MGPSTASPGSKRLDDCFQRREQVAAPARLLTGELGSDGGEAARQYVQVSARLKGVSGNGQLVSFADVLRAVARRQVIENP